MNSDAPAAVRPVPAATLMLLRDGHDGLEVLMIRRPSTTAFAADAFVFPGGKVEPADCSMPSISWTGLDLEVTAAEMQLPSDLALGFHVAAVRETFEEVGILLADRTSAARDLRHSLREMRRSLHAGNDDWAQSLERSGLRLDLGALRWWSWWITPPSLPRRYNTRFFAAECPASPVLTDSREVEETAWIKPGAAVQSATRGAWYLMRPTITTLNELAEYSSVTAVLAAADQHHERRSYARP